MSRASHGFPSMGRGIRIPFGDPELDAILTAIQRHADCDASPSTSGNPEALISIYDERDQELYEITDELRSKVAERWPGVLYHEELLEAVEAHSKARRPKLPSGDSTDIAHRYEERDAELYDTVASLRAEAMLIEAGGGVYFDQEGLDALLAGRKTVMRIPVEYNRFGKRLFAHYDVHGGAEPTYPIYGPSERGGYRIIEGQRLKVVSLEMESLQPLTDAQAKLEGCVGCTNLLGAWEQRHGEFPLAWLVHRYEIEPVPS